MSNVTRNEAIARLERCKEWRYADKWRALSQEEREKIERRARKMSTRDLMMMVTDGENIKTEFRGSPWANELQSRISRMTETEKDQMFFRASSFETADARPDMFHR